VGVVLSALVLAEHVRWTQPLGALVASASGTPARAMLGRLTCKAHHCVASTTEPEPETACVHKGIRFR
jgi:hypothetical protein